MIGVSILSPEKARRIVQSWRQIRWAKEDLSSWPTDFTRDINPIPCHSHNDYWRPVPLYSAISAGCISVEADVWLVNESDMDLFVGHSTSSLTHNRTFKNLYIDPLVNLLDRQNPITDFHPNRSVPPHGIFDTDPSRSITLLVDFKTPGLALWPHVLAQLDPLRSRNYLTYFNGASVVTGPVTVVCTGNCPFELLVSNVTYRDVFFDAPLEKMWEAPSEGANNADKRTAPQDHSLERARLIKKENVDRRA